MADAPNGASDALCAAVAATGFEDLPQSTVAAARRVLLDATGVILGASGMALEARPFIDLAARTQGVCTILGTGRAAAAAQAAFANGAMVHALDYEDAFDAAPGHPNASLVPALLALAQDRGGVDGRRFLTALVIGCEVSCRVALALDKRMEDGGWYPPPITAAFGAAAGAGHLLGLDAAQQRDCLSLMLCQAVMPGEIKHSRQTVLRAVREAFPAQAAVISAQLASAGVAGFERPLEGEGGFYALFAGGEFSAARLSEGFGSHFLIEDLTFKPWPSCRGTHPFIEMALDLAGEWDEAGQIAAVTVEISPVQRMLVEPLARKRAPQVAIDAKFSIPFTFALAACRGRVGLDDFGADSLADPQVLALAAKVDSAIVETSDRNSGSGGAVRVRMADGRELRREVREALGAPERPLGEETLREKFIDCAGRAQRPVPRDAAERLADRIMALETCEDVGALFA